MKKKTIVSILLLLFVLTCIALVYFKYSSKEEQSIPSSFLKEFYTVSNHEIENFSMKDKDELVQFYENKFNTYLTKNCFQQLFKNGDVIDYLSLLQSNNCSIKAHIAALEETNHSKDKIQFSYNIELEIHKNETIKTATGTGIITVEKTQNNDWKITYFKRTDKKSLNKLIIQI